VHLSLFAPAKLNLFLAITGRRNDGFHDLVSVVAPLTFGDTLTVELRDMSATKARFEVTCNDPAVPTDASNLVIRAAQAFVDQTKWTGAAVFRLDKKIPAGAGLGGGSSDGVAALRALNQLCGERLTGVEMARVAATLGSDCPLFLHDRAVVMRGRGERIEPVSEDAARRLRSRRVLVFKPSFGVATAWAYQRMAAMADATAKQSPAPAVDSVYLASPLAEKRLAAWLGDSQAPAEALLFNNLERPAFEKYLALPSLLDQLRGDFGLAPRMTGSGSACFAFLPENAPVAAITEAIRAGWGDSAFVIETNLA
jgi:4-diphosphocytidyl-2-C-methyl-D-erythritol kinase